MNILSKGLLLTALVATAMTASETAFAGIVVSCFVDIPDSPPAGATGVPCNALLFYGDDAVQLSPPAPLTVHTFPGPVGPCPGHEYRAAQLAPSTTYAVIGSLADHGSFTTGLTADLEPPLFAPGPDDEGAGVSFDFTGSDDILFISTTFPPPPDLAGGWYVAVAPEGKRLDLTSATGGDVCDGTPLPFTAFDRAGNSTEATVVVRSPTPCPSAAGDEGGCSLVARPLPPGRARGAIACLLLGGLLMGRRRAIGPSPYQEVQSNVADT